MVGEVGVEAEATERAEAVSDEETGVAGEEVVVEEAAFLPNEKNDDTLELLLWPPWARLSAAAGFCSSGDVLWRGAGVMDTRAAEARAG